MCEIRVRKLARDEAAAWPEALELSATFTALDPWSNLVQQTYGYEIYRFEATRNDKVVGILVLTHVRHPIFGNYLTTSPFGSYGGFAYLSTEARDALSEQARLLAYELGVEYAVLRFVDDGSTPPTPWQQHPIYCTYMMDLPTRAEELWESFNSQYRNHIRKSLKKGFSIKFGHLDLLDDVYEGLARSMHELGSPYHGKAYLRRMAEALGHALEFAVVHGPSGELVGAGVFIFHGKAVTNLHANILRKFRPDYAGDFLYWSVITRYGERGFSTLDMGRSLIGSGNETFKMKWKPRKQSLAYWYVLRPGATMPELNQKNPRFQFAIWLWQRLPDFVVRPLGPLLIKGLA
jgi:FemAB-related protein (PEP-CTERM system-associated)